MTTAGRLARLLLLAPHVLGYSHFVLVTSQEGQMSLLGRRSLFPSRARMITLSRHWGRTVSAIATLTSTSDFARSTRR